MTHFFLDKDLVEKCFAAVYEGTGLDMNGNASVDKYKFAGTSGNPELLVKLVPHTNEQIQIILASGLTEHLIYQGTKAELERRIKIIAMESSLKDETKNPNDFVPNFDDEDEDE
jgi:hypothetical protein